LYTCTVPKRAFYGTVPVVNTRISAAKRSKRRSAPNTVNGTVPPRRLLNAKRRPREYLTVKEVGKLVEGARSRGRYGRRDATMILVAYRHGLRASELCALRWDQVDPERGLVHVRRLKNGTPARRHASSRRSRSRRGDGTSRRDHDAGGARRGVDAKRRRRGPFIPAAEINDSSWPPPGQARGCPGHPKAIAWQSSARRQAAASQDEKPRIFRLFLRRGINFAAWMAGTPPGLTRGRP